MPPVLLRARWVLPVDQPPIDGGVVTIHDGKIVSVGPSSGPSSSIEDLGDVVLMPGLVNAHSHLEFSLLDEPLGVPGMPLCEWIRLVISHRKQSRHDSLSGVAHGLRQSASQGVTWVAEIAPGGSCSYQELDSGVNLTLLEEVIGFSGARRESALEDVRSRLHRSCRPPIASRGVSPHAPYTVHPQLVEQLVELARPAGRPVAMHLAESLEELQLLATGEGPFRELLEERSMWDPAAIERNTRPLHYLELLSRAPRALVIHGNFLDTEEIDFLATRRDRMSVIYCPRTHAYFEHPRYALPAMAEAGLQIAIGTDSRASNPDLSLLEELRYIAKVFPELPPSTIVEMGTLGGAKALGCDQLIGSITAGKRADLTLVAIEPSESDPYEAILQAAPPPGRTWLGGHEFREPGIS